MAHYNVYREQLAALYHGHALWEPDPANLYDQVEVGDVGYVRQGHFHRLFNVLLPAEDPSHELLGVPEDFEPLHVGPSHLRILALPRGDYYSHSVRAADVAVGAQIAAGAGPVTGSFRASFSCSKKQGAVLSLPFDARREDTFRKGDFRSYIVTHCERWFAFTQANGLDVDHMEEIILVTGCDRTEPWALAAFTNSQSSASISFDVCFMQTAGPALKWEVRQQEGQSVPYNYGPRVEQTPRPNQCVFIRGFRAKKRPLQILPVKLLAAAEPRPDDGSEPPSEDMVDRIEVEDLAEPPEFCDPVVPILDYVLQELPHVSVAIAHDDDLKLIKGLEMLTANAIREHLETLHSHRDIGTSSSGSAFQSVADLSNVLDPETIVEPPPALPLDRTGDENFEELPIATAYAISGGSGNVKQAIDSELPANDIVNKPTSILHRRNVSQPTPIRVDPPLAHADANWYHAVHSDLVTPASSSESRPLFPRHDHSSQIIRHRPHTTQRSLPPVPRPHSSAAAPRLAISHFDAPPPYAANYPSYLPSPIQYVSLNSRDSFRRPMAPRGPRSRIASQPSTAPFTGTFSHPRSSGDDMDFDDLESASMSIFATEPVPFKGRSFEAAKWTMTSQQIQAIVSKAIRQSADPTSMRLLLPSELNGTIPQELLRLEMLQRDLKAEHALQTLRRDALFKALSEHSDAKEGERRKQLEELQTVVTDSDHIAAELYKARDQVAQIRQLIDMHSRSALALALRRINASALYSSTEAQTLRGKVAAAQEAVIISTKEGAGGVSARSRELEGGSWSTLKSHSSGIKSESNVRTHRRGGSLTA